MAAHSSILVFSSGKSYGQRSLAGYSPWGYKRVRHNLASKQYFLKLRLKFRLICPHFKPLDDIEIDR